jgi:hypothetical protein
LTRIEFKENTKWIIAGRAGYRCSFPTCNRNTIGPGKEPYEVSCTGIAAHIFSASPGGPRGQGGLTGDELAQPENGIWLCSECANKVDKNDGGRFSSNSLLSYKHLHETRIMREHQGLYAPIGWLYGLSIGKNPIFRVNQKLTFAKLNLLFGENGTGKTAILNWLSSAFGCPIEQWNRLNHDEIEFDVTYLNPEDQTIHMVSDGHGNARIAVNGKPTGINPILIKTIQPKGLEHDCCDDRIRLAHCLGIRHCDVDSLIAEIHQFPYSHIQNARFEEGITPCKMKQEEEINAEGKLQNRSKPRYRVLRMDLQDTAPGLSLSQLSGGQRIIVIIEFATALARISGRYAPTVLMLDDIVSCIELGEWLKLFSHHLADPSNQFQTFLCASNWVCSHEQIRWEGWQVIRTHGRSPECEITQEPHFEPTIG